MPAFYYTQTDAFLYGGEAGFHVHPLKWLHLEGSYSNTFGQDANSNDLPLIPSQKINAEIRTSFAFRKVLDKLSFYLQEQYSFAQNRIAAYETSTDDYNLLNAGLIFEFRFNRQNIFFNVAVQNILNEKYYDHLSRYKEDGTNNMGRNFRFQLSVPLQTALKN
jgi:iron complex outermembrane receptor protein